MHRALSVCAAILLSFPTTGSAQRQDESLQLFIEAGVRTPKAAAGLSKVLGNIPNVPEELATAMEHLDQLERGSFPLTFRMYVPGDWSYQRNPEPPYFLVVLDSENDLPIDEWLEDYGVPGGGSGSLVFRERERRNGGHRYLLGDRQEEVRNELRRLRGDDLPQPSRAQHRLLGKVSGNDAYAFIDLTKSIAQSGLQALRGAGGTGAAMFAFGAKPSRGTWNVDVHWGVQAGKGMVGAFIPNQPQPCRLDELLPWKPGLALEANLGPGLGRHLVRMNVLDTIEVSEARDLMETLLDVWEGPIGFFQPEPDPGYRPPAIAPPTLQLSSEYVVLVRIDRDNGEEVMEALADGFGAMAQRTEAGTFAIDTRYRSTHIGYHRGVIAVCSTTDPETSAGRLERVFEAADGRRKATWRIDHELKGIVQMYVSRAASRRLSDTVRSLGHAAPGGNWVGRMLTERTKRSEIGLSLQPDEDSLRLRVRF